MESKMYISESPSSNGHREAGTKYSSSTSSIPSLFENSFEASDDPDKAGVQLSPTATPGGVQVAYRARDNKERRHSVLDGLKARRDSFFQKARRHSIFAEDKENKEKNRRDSDGGSRRGSVFYVSSDLLAEETNTPQQPITSGELKDDDDAVVVIAGSQKKGRRKSWHPLVGKPPKLDRKRRKGVADGPQISTGAAASSEQEVGSAEILYTRHKRTSWWNIFADPSR